MTDGSKTTETTNKVDFTEIFDVVTELKGGNKIAAISWLFKNRDKLGGIVSFLKGIGSALGIGKKQVDVTPIAPAQPDAPVVVPGVPAEARRVAGLRLAVTAIEIPKSDKPGSGQRLLNKSEFDRVMSGQDPIDAGSRIHTDCTPFDQWGKPFQPGDPANDLLLFDPNAGQAWENFRLKDVIYEDLALENTQDGEFTEATSNYDDFGCTTVFKISRGIPNGEQHTVRFAKRYVKKDVTLGEVILLESNSTTEIRVKPWVTA